MDSSSIVCIADALIAAGKAETPRLDTLSYYNESEPNWDERPYFQKVEEKRGRTGCHIDLTSQKMFEIYVDAETLVATPAARLYRSSLDRQSTAYMLSQGNRVVLSGIGGDEFVGGIPTPLPELADLLVGLRFGVLARQLKLWALRSKRPVVGLLFDCIRQFSPRVFRGRNNQSPLPWLRSAFVNRHRSSLLAQGSRLKILGAAPSFQGAMTTLDGIRKHIACLSVPPNLPFDRRYPYLDRDLIEFLLAIPREQLVRPGQRRSLMRRALAGIVPDEVLNRKRKAYAARGAILAVSRAGASAVTRGMVSDSLDIIDEKSFLEALHAAGHGQGVPVVPLIRTLDLEFWLRDLQQWRLSERVLDGIGQRPCMSTKFAMDEAVGS
jgi:asparagine synthase (glutamine-hydrolysing)